MRKIWQYGTLAFLSILFLLGFSGGEVQATASKSNNMDAPLSKLHKPIIATQTSNGKRVLAITGSSIFNSTASKGLSYLRNDIENLGFDFTEKVYSDKAIDLLKDYDIVIFGMSDNVKMTTEQALKFESYVQSGGNLFIMGELNADNYSVETVNKISQQFGISYIPGLLVQENSRTSNGIMPIITDIRDSKITEGVDSMIVNWGSALKVKSPAKSLANSDNDAWVEKDAIWDWFDSAWSVSKDYLDDFNPPYSVLASSEYGIGRVVATADTGLFINGWYDEYDHQTLATNIISWLGSNDYKAKLKFTPLSKTVAAACPENLSKDERCLVMKGGKAVRQYVVKDQNNMTLRSYSIDYRFKGDSKIYTSKTDENGVIEIETPIVEKETEFEIEPVNSNRVSFVNVPKFTVGVKDLNFSQEYNATGGVTGSFGAGEGAEFKLGPLQAKAEVGSLDVGASKLGTVMFKYDTHGDNYDFTYGLGLEKGVNVSLEAGVSGNLAEAVKLDPINFAGGGGLAKTYNFESKIKNYSNPQTQKDFLKNPFRMYSQILSISAINNENNQLLLYVKKIVDKKADKEQLSEDTFSAKTTVNANAEANLGELSVDTKVELGTENKKTPFELGVNLASISGSMESSIKRATKEDDAEELVLNTVKKEDASLFKMRGKFSNVDAELDDNGQLEKSKFINDEQKFVVKDGKVQNVTFSAYEQPEDSSGWFNSKLTSQKRNYTIDADNFTKFSDKKEVTKVLNKSVSFFNDNAKTINEILNDENGEATYINEKVESSKFTFPLELGIGLGAKVKVGADFEGSYERSYESENGYVSNGLRYYTAKYDNEDQIDEQSKELQTAIEDISSTVSAVIEDKYDQVKGYLKTGVEYVKDGVKVGIESIKKSKVIAHISTFKDLIVAKIQTDIGSAKVVGDIYIVSFSEDDESIDRLEEGTGFTITYTDDQLKQLGLADKEDQLSIFHWDEKEGVYVRMPREVSTEENTVRTTITEAGQYVLAYNKFTPVFKEPTITQNGDKQQLSINVKDSFEKIDKTALNVSIDGEELDEDLFTYKTSTGLLTASLEGLNIGKHTITYSVYTDEGPVEFNYDFEKQGAVNLFESSDVKRIDEKTVRVTANVKDMAQLSYANVIYTLNDGITRTAFMTKGKDNTLSADLASDEEIASIYFTIETIDQNRFHSYSEYETKQFDNKRKLAVMDTNLGNGVLYFTDRILLTFSNTLSDDTDLSEIVIQDSTGKDIGVTKKIKGKQIEILPASSFDPNETYTVVLPEQTVTDVYGNQIKQSLRYKFAAVKYDDLQAYDAMKKWSVTFNEDVEDKTIGTNIYILSEDGQRQEVKITKLSERVVSIEPSTALASGNYSVVVSNNISNKNKQKLAKLFVRSFAVE